MIDLRPRIFSPVLLLTLAFMTVVVGVGCQQHGGSSITVGRDETQLASANDESGDQEAVSREYREERQTASSSNDAAGNVLVGSDAGQETGETVDQSRERLLDDEHGVRATGEQHVGVDDAADDGAVEESVDTSDAIAEKSAQAADTAPVNAPHSTTDAASDGGDSDGANGEESPVPLNEPQPLLEPFPHIRVDLDRRQVLIDAETCLDAGWLEQVVCGVGTREHESLVVTSARPSNIHASLLLAGFESGRPGQWNYDGDSVSVTSPEGDALEVLVRYTDESGNERTHSVRRWIRDHDARVAFPDDPWIFAGSMIQHDEQLGGDYYVADYSGSIVGLVTFGDELVGFSNVLADKEAVEAPMWEVNAPSMPPLGTKVTVILQAPSGVRKSAPNAPAPTPQKQP